jgi:hypothetical protein
MRKTVLTLLALSLLLSLASGCQSYTQTGMRSSSHQTLKGGDLQMRIKKANGSSTQDIEVEGGSGLTLDTEVTLSVETGSFVIELLGEDGQVTLVLEARDGEMVSGFGRMVVDSFDDASYRVTATEATNVEYSMDYTFR